MISLTISGNNPAEFNASFAFYANALGYVPREKVAEVARQALLQAAGKATQPPQDASPAEPEKPAETQEAPPLEGEVLPPEKPRGRGRPPKQAAEKPVEAPAEKQQEREKPAEPEKALTHDDVRVAMKDLAARVSVEAVAKLLAEFNVAKASEVPVERIGEFVEKAKAVTA